MWEPPLREIMASRNTSTPIPPIQWVKLRQNNAVWESTSTFSRMLAPVVVKPDTVSNSASVRDGISFDNQNGRAPKKLIKIQLSAVVTQPSFR